MIQKDIAQLLQPTLENMGYELWGLEYLPQGKYALLRVFIDKDDGINIDDCERASRQISAVLDVEDPIAQNYTLEVSSPGIPRPLFYKEQYLRYLGEKVQIKLFQPIDGRKKIIGMIMSADSQALELDLGEERKTVLFSNIIKANLMG